jgi:outer membrane receptor protein involved in Fe transport
MVYGFVVCGHAVADELLTRKPYDIAPQPLDSALLAFSDQADIQLVVASQSLYGLDSIGISAEMTGQDALEELLRDTGLRYDRVGNTVTVTSSSGAEDNARGKAWPVSVPITMGQTQTPAQNTQTNPEAGRTTNPELAQNDRDVEEIVVTGSQIKGAQITDSLPVTVLTEASIEATGASSGDDLFRELASAGSVSFGGNATRSITGGVNGARGDVASINLRNLGTGNTLVLINGRRMVNHPAVQTDPPGLVPVTTANMNSIPVMGLSRVEVLRDGASAIYGTDAIAGVINNVLRSDYEGLEFAVRYGEPKSSSGQDLTLNLHGGVTFNNNRTNISFDTTWYQRDPMLTNDRIYSRSSDLRPLVVGTAFEGDTQFRNTSTSTPWGTFVLPNPVTLNGVTSSVFHIQPNTLPGCLAGLPAGPGDICLDEGTIDTELQYDGNAAATGRTMNNEVERFNHFMTFNHNFDTGIEMYGEVGLFFANSTFQRSSGNTPLDSHPVWIPGENYWNPFGATTLPDGSPNPNRLPGLDINQVPAEGLVIPLHGGTGYRILDNGSRLVEVDDRSWRFVTGFRGELFSTGWDFDSAIVYSEAISVDSTSDRISNNAFQAAAASATPAAYNFFNGAGIGNTVIDGTPNPDIVLDRFYIVSDKDNKATLALADFKLSKGDLFALFGNDVGAAFGLEFRRERYEDDRDPRLDETVLYTDYFGDTFGSDTMNSSPTPDTFGERKVWSAFVELAIPLVSEANSIPLINSLDVQLAARYEDFSDVGDIVKPRIALGWYPIEQLQVRASYSEGFRAPNLAQTNEGITRRVRFGTDWYYCQAQVNKGDVPNLNACDGSIGLGNNIDFALERLSFGTSDLVPEETENVSYGIVWTPTFIDGLIITADYWEITQNDLVGLFGEENHLALDWAMRINGLGPNPLVVRSDPTPEEIAFFAGSGLDPVGAAIQNLDQYLNFDFRETTGIDFEVHYRLRELKIGDFDIDLGISRMFRKEQSVSGAGAFINSPGESAVQVQGGGDLMKRDQDPYLRATGSVRWYFNNWDASVNASYVGEVFDTSVTNDVTGDWWVIDSWLTFGAKVGYTIADGALEGTRFTLGARNLTDEDPPLADDNFGFVPQLHNPYGRYLYVSAQYQF